MFSDSILCMFELFKLATNDSDINMNKSAVFKFLYIGGITLVALQ